MRKCIIKSCQNEIQTVCFKKKTLTNGNVTRTNLVLIGGHGGGHGGGHDLGGGLLPKLSP